MKKSLLLSSKILCALATSVAAHPHVFVDGGLDFVMRDKTTLAALEVTWVFDEFETLYLLSSADVTLTDANQLPTGAWSALESEIGAWPESFSGSAHLSAQERAIALKDPVDFDVRMTGNRLELTFTRALTEPLDLKDTELEAAFYEATYFYDFSVTQPPSFIGAQGGCTADVIPFVADDQLDALQSTLLALGRDDIPDTPRVGALFADRILVRCAQ